MDILKITCNAKGVGTVLALPHHLPCELCTIYVILWLNNILSIPPTYNVLWASNFSRLGSVPRQVYRPESFRLRFFKTRILRDDPLNFLLFINHCTGVVLKHFKTILEFL